MLSYVTCYLVNKVLVLSIRNNVRKSIKFPCILKQKFDAFPLMLHPVRTGAMDREKGAYGFLFDEQAMRTFLSTNQLLQACDVFRLN